MINTSPLRSDIEFISRKYWETLTFSLRSSILKDMTQLQDFLNTSTQALQSATIMEEQYIDDAATKCEQIVADLSTVISLETISCKMVRLILVFHNLCDIPDGRGAAFRSS